MSKRTSCDAARVGDRHRDRDDQAADDRRRDVEAREDRDGAPQPVAGEENDSSDSDGIDEIQGKHRDRSGVPAAAGQPEGRQIITPTTARRSPWRLRTATGRATAR